MKHRYSIVALTATLLALSACGKAASPDQAKDTTPAVATINGKPVSGAEFNVFVDAMSRQSGGEPNAEQKGKLLDQFIAMQLAADSAEKAGLSKDKDVQTQLALMRMNVLAEAQFKKYLDEHPISDADLKAEYDAQVARMPHEYHARHILVDNKADADAIIAQLKKGGDFEKLAKDKSKDPSGKNGGDLGWFTPDSMVKPFSDALVKLEPGKYTDEPVQSQYGWHVIKLEESRTASVPDFEQVKGQVKNILQRKKIQAYLDDLRAKAKIEKKS